MPNEVKKLFPKCFYSVTQWQSKFDPEARIFFWMEISKKRRHLAVFCKKQYAESIKAMPLQADSVSCRLWTEVLLLVLLRFAQWLVFRGCRRREIESCFWNRGESVHLYLSCIYHFLFRQWCAAKCDYPPRFERHILTDRGIFEITRALSLILNLSFVYPPKPF